MLIALLAVLGVDLIVVVVFLAGVLVRRRWVSRQVGSFKGAARVVQGEVPGLKRRWKRGYGRWVGEVFVWTPGPLCLRNALAPIEGVADTAVVDPKVKRLGEHPKAFTLSSPATCLEIIVRAGDADLATGPYPDKASLADATPAGI